MYLLNWPIALFNPKNYLKNLQQILLFAKAKTMAILKYHYNINAVVTKLQPVKVFHPPCGALFKKRIHSL